MAQTVEILIQVMYGVLAGAVYGFVWYARNRLRREKSARQNFRPMKLAATVVVAGVIGGVASVSGNVVEFDTVAQQVTYYAGAIALVEGVLKTVVEVVQPTR